MTKQEMIAKLKEAMDMANNRWSEWGERATSTQEILDSILYESVDAEGTELAQKAIRPGAAPMTAPKDTDFPDRVLAMCQSRGWTMKWTERASVLFCEVAELVEAYRGKRSTVLEEAADVLIATAAIVGAAGVSWDDVFEWAAKKVAANTITKKQPPNSGEKEPRK